MAARKKIFNPFYLLLAPVGALFFLTAFGYGVLAFEAVQPVRLTEWSSGGNAEHPLVAWLRVSGERVLLAELGLLAVLTIGSIVYEIVWERAARDQREKVDLGELP